MSADVSEPSYPRLRISGFRTVAVLPGNRSTAARYAAKLIAWTLFESVRSAGGRRSDPPSSVPKARWSYAAHASYMEVWAIARARATMGGPSFDARTP